MFDVEFWSYKLQTIENKQSLRDDINLISNNANFKPLSQKDGTIRFNSRKGIKRLQCRQ